MLKFHGPNASQTPCSPFYFPFLPPSLRLSPPTPPYPLLHLSEPYSSSVSLSSTLGTTYHYLISQNHISQNIGDHTLNSTKQFLPSISTMKCILKTPSSSILTLTLLAVDIAFSAIFTAAKRYL